MAAQEVLHQLQSLGVSVKARGNDLVVNPASRIPPQLKTEIREYKGAILALLDPSVPSSDDSNASLLAWAAEAAETDLTLPKPVHFLETPLRPYTTTEVGLYCRQQLMYLSLARSTRATGGRSRYTPEYWTEMEINAIEALAALQEAVNESDTQGVGQP